MKNSIDIEYVVQHIDGKNVYLGWAIDYKGVVVQADSFDEMREEIITSIRVLFLHFISELDKKSIKINIYEK